MKKRLTVFLLIATLLLFPQPVKALSEFETKHLTEYRLNSRGGATVKQTITLTNNFANIYPKEYRIEIESPVQSITAWDDKGSILQSINQEGQKTIIRLNFNEKSIGKGKDFTFYLEYQLLDFATKKGKVWEVIVPQISSSEEEDQYQVEIYIPAVFGHLSYSSSKPFQTLPLTGQTKYVFRKNQIKDSGIMMAFGEFQTFDFTLRYFLDNPTSGPVNLEIPIPPETNYQELVYSQITPAPEETNIDVNGNWLMKYELDPKQILEVVVKGQAKIASTPKTTHFYNQKQALEMFTKPDVYWQTNNSQIVSLANDLKTPKKIYDYVVDKLTYNYNDLNGETIQRKGALKALSFPEESVCSEFADLFVALCRAAGIPAREIEGFAYTNNPKIKPLSLKRDVLHAWPEYWDEAKSSWIQVDPTWENTTGGIDYFNHLDLNHFAFVIHGTESQYPPPPGSYQDKTNMKKTIEVDFANNQLEVEKKEFDFFVDLKKDSLLLINKESQTAILKNNSKTIYKNIKVNYLGTNVDFLGLNFKLPKPKKEGELANWAIIPPFGKKEFFIPKSFSIVEAVFNTNYQIEVIDDQENSQTITVGNIKEPDLLKKAAETAIIVFLLGLVFILIFKLVKVAKKKLF